MEISVHTFLDLRRFDSRPGIYIYIYIFNIIVTIFKSVESSLFSGSKYRILMNEEKYMISDIRKRLQNQIYLLKYMFQKF